MAAERFYLPSPTVANSNGFAVAGALANFYLTGTTTRTPTYTTSALSTQHANPVIADSAGRFPNIYLDDAVTYRLVITDPDGVTIVDTDPYIAPITQTQLDDVLDAVDSITSEQKLILLAPEGETVPAGIYPVDENVRYGASLTRFYGKADGATTFELQINDVPVYSGAVTTTLSATIDIEVEIGDRVTYAILTTSARYIYLNADGGAG